jgi:hypothetical protein
MARNFHALLDKMGRDLGLTGRHCFVDARPCSDGIHEWLA